MREDRLTRPIYEAKDLVRKERGKLRRISDREVKAAIEIRCINRTDARSVEKDRNKWNEIWKRLKKSNSALTSLFKVDNVWD